MSSSLKKTEMEVAKAVYYLDTEVLEAEGLSMLDS